MALTTAKKIPATIRTAIKAVSSSSHPGNQPMLTAIGGLV
jgi:hypothetical protein